MSARTPRLQTVDLVLAANEERVLALDADFFDVQEATGAVEVKLDGQYAARLEKGLGWEAPRDERGFARLHVRDVSGAPNTVRIAYGVGAFHDRRTTVSGAVSLAGAIPAGNNNIGDVDVASIAAGTNSIGKLNTPASVDDAADITLNNGSQTSLGAAPAGTRFRVIVADPANTVDIRIGAMGGGLSATRGALLQPGQSITLNTSATVGAFAAAAGQKISQAFVVD